MEEKCPICEQLYTKRNPKVNAHLKYQNPEETMVSCRNCNTAEYYYRQPGKISLMSSFWKWWWRKRIKLVMKYYKENRIILKTLNQ
jgi:hypothetical protein